MMIETDLFKKTLEAFAVGDAMGMPLEFMTRNYIRERFGIVDELIDPSKLEDSIHSNLEKGSITDDTEQNLYLIEEYCKTGRIDTTSTVSGLIRWIEERKPEKKGYIGPSTLESLKRILEGEKPEKAGFGKTTCGSAMRILAVVFCSGRLNEDELVRIIHSSCIPTHNTNIAFESSLTLGMAYHMLILGCDLNDIMDKMKNIPEMMEKIDVPRFVGASTVDRILNLAEFSSRIRSDEDFLDFLYGVVGTTMEANEVVPVSFLIFLRSGDDVWEAIRLGASVGGDTDTISAIAGALSTLYAKDHNIPKATVDEVVERNGLNLERYAGMIEKIWNV